LQTALYVLRFGKGRYTVIGVVLINLKFDQVICRYHRHCANHLYI